MDFQKVTTGWHRIIASDPAREGMTMELWNGDQMVGEVFFSDHTGQMTMTLRHGNLPLEQIEDLIEDAKRKLPPSALPKEEK